MHTGVRQGCILSPTHFAIFIDGLGSRRPHARRLGRLSDRRQQRRFPDDHHDRNADIHLRAPVQPSQAICRVDGGAVPRDGRDGLFAPGRHLLGRTDTSLPSDPAGREHDADPASDPPARHRTARPPQSVDLRRRAARRLRLSVGCDRPARCDDMDGRMVLRHGGSRIAKIVAGIDGGDDDEPYRF